MCIRWPIFLQTEIKIALKWDDCGERPFLWPLTSFPDRHTHSVHSVPVTLYVLVLSYRLYTLYYTQYTSHDKDSWPCSDWPLATGNWQLATMSRSACSIILSDSLLLLARASRYSHAYRTSPISPVTVPAVLYSVYPPALNSSAGTSSGPVALRLAV